MVAVERRLEGISTGYSVFEKDQVLTHDQLNSVAEYADDQIRLTRVGLLGVGIACGLRASVTGGNVRVSKGVGVTTDGDLVYLAQDQLFTRFKPYDQSYPAYAPLYVSGDVNGTKIPAYELVQGTADPRGVALGQFSTQAGRALGTMTALLLVESYRKDDDLCSGTDCDNLGAVAINTLKVLLVENPPATLLQQGMSTPSQAHDALAEIVVNRPTFPATLGSTADLAAIYRTACNAIHAKLVAALPTIHASVGTFLGEAVGSASAGAWTAKLNGYNTLFAGATAGIQYYYGFLKDVADTFNEFRERLYGDFTTCAPAAETFPKHLLLGDLTPGSNPDVNRTGFYPSPLTGRSAGELDHARFLLRRLDALINRFQVSTDAALPVRITPSAFEDRPLDERAIPFYYNATETADPIQRKWSYRLTRRGMEAFTHSYHATGWGTQSGTANPLTSQLGRYSFFRIEGHVGKGVAAALTALEGEIRARNLPFVVRAVHLGTATSGVVKKPGPRITDLHHIHQIVRKDLARRLEEAESFNTTFTARVSDALAQKRIEDHADDYETTSIQETSSQKSGQVASNASAARIKLNQPYTSYVGQSGSWQQEYANAMGAATEYKYHLSPVVKTEFQTPFDTLVSHTFSEWVTWLEQIIAWKEARQDEKLLFSKFAERHPQIEHFGGVTRGGTFVLLHDTAGTVVADFMLPYAWLEEQIETQEPTLTVPASRPPHVVTDGIKIIPSRVTVMEKKWVEKFKPQIERDLNWKEYVDDYLDVQAKLVDERLELQSKLIDEQLEFQTKHIDTFQNFYVDAFKESMNVVTNIPSYSQTTTPTPDVTQQFDDKLLGLYVQEAHTRKELIDTLDQELSRTDLDAGTVKQYEEMRAVAEQDLAGTIQTVTTYVAQSGTDVKAGTQEFTALVEVANTQTAITSTATTEMLTQKLSATVEGATSAITAGVIAGVMNVPFRR